MHWTLYAGPAITTVFLWWGATGVIAWLVGRPARHYPALLVAATLLAGLSLWGLTQSRAGLHPQDAWIAFLAALGLWSWIEITFLTGRITGPLKAPRTAPSGATWRHARDALAAILWHEFAIIAIVALAALLSASGDNPIGLYTLLLLWIMRSSAKLNLFLGVRNLGELFLPPHLAHLLGYLRRRPMNALFPFSIALGIALTALCLIRIVEASTAFEAVGFSLLATLAGLALIEHLLMVLPLPAETLWRWSLRPSPPGDSP